MILYPGEEDLLAVISATDLTKTYQVPVRDAGFRASLAALFHRRYQPVQAVQSLSFAIEQGEVVGFLGPNGAGKTTTLKMLSGILYPTAGRAEVLGCVPWERKERFLRRIAMIRGSRPLGVPVELTVLDALRFQRLIYDLSEREFQRNLAELAALLDLAPLLPRQIRQLSLGERMRAGLAWSLVYGPRVLFLDEPTIGLDVAVAEAMRRLIADYREHTGAAVILTSHHMADVETLCRRVILIDGGHLVYDGNLAGLTARLAPYKILRVATHDPGRVDWQRYGTLVMVDDGGAELRVERAEIPAVTARLLADLPVSDLTIQDPPLETVIAAVYQGGAVA